VLRPDGTFRVEGTGGTWKTDHQRKLFILRFRTGCKPVYRGALEGRAAEGTIRCTTTGGRGVFYIDPLRVQHL
jgi:hypothetical protein